MRQNAQQFHPTAATGGDEKPDECGVVVVIVKDAGAAVAAAHDVVPQTGNVAIRSLAAACPFLRNRECPLFRVATMAG